MHTRPPQSPGQHLNAAFEHIASLVHVSACVHAVLRVTVGHMPPLITVVPVDVTVGTEFYTISLIFLRALNAYAYTFDPNTLRDSI
jgi:hypothetical protein